MFRHFLLIRGPYVVAVAIVVAGDGASMGFESLMIGGGNGDDGFDFVIRILSSFLVKLVFVAVEFVLNPAAMC